LAVFGGKRRPFSVASAVRRNYASFLGIGLFSGLINILALTGSLYMLQVYDRVLPSHSVPTLVALTILMVVLYSGHGLLDLIRTRIMARIGLKIDASLRAKIFAAVLILPLRLPGDRHGLQPVRDLDQIRAFLSSLGPTALFDMPWIPLYLAVVFILHPLLGLFAAAGALVLVCVTVMTEVRSSEPMQSAAASGNLRVQFGEAARRNAEAIQAMGMGARADAIWRELNGRYLADQLAASDAMSGMGTFSKILRMLLQSGILGLGAYLAVRGEVTAGVIIAASITMSRALAPIELAIAHWRGFLAARQGYKRLKLLFKDMPDNPAVMALPRPNKVLQVEGLAVAAPGTMQPIVQGISFTLQAGSGLGIIGPSASGKTTLARALVGAWAPMPRGGTVRLDGAALDQYGGLALGQDIGYLPQTIELFDATVAQNIARLDSEASSEAVIKAATLAGVHEMILRLPEGYNTRTGEAGCALSAGQRQRLALARALYCDPFLVVLDEPNANLDSAGDAALAEAIRSVRARNGVVVVIAHRPAALANVDLVMAMAQGRVQAFGPKEEVLRKVLQPSEPAGPGSRTAVGLKVVPEGKAGV
jgi:PrtD family type I secretion system ABC transporter